MTRMLCYNPDLKDSTNQARGLFAIAEQIGRLADAVEGIGLNGATRGAGTDDRGCLERLAVDLPEAIDRLAERLPEAIERLAEKPEQEDWA